MGLRRILGNMLRSWIDENDILTDVTNIMQKMSGETELPCIALLTWWISVKSRTLNNGSEQEVISYQYGTSWGLEWPSRMMVLSLEDVQRYIEVITPGNYSEFETYSFSASWLLVKMTFFILTLGTYSAISHRYELDSDVLEKNTKSWYITTCQNQSCVWSYLDILENSRASCLIQTELAVHFYLWFAS